MYTLADKPFQLWDFKLKNRIFDFIGWNPTLRIEFRWLQKMIWLDGYRIGLVSFSNRIGAFWTKKITVVKNETEIF